MHFLKVIIFYWGAEFFSDELKYDSSNMQLYFTMKMWLAVNENKL